jgi:hypothetical protein
VQRVPLQLHPGNVPATPVLDPYMVLVRLAIAGNYIVAILFAHG